MKIFVPLDEAERFDVESARSIVAIGVARGWLKMPVPAVKTLLPKKKRATVARSALAKSRSR
jgi:hypothetical protein